MAKREDDPGRRVRTILGVARGGPTPRVRLGPLRQYHAYLAANLAFPFEGRLCDPVGPHRDTRSPVRALRLVDADTYAPEEMAGLICTAEQNGERIELPLDRIDVGEQTPNHRTLEDYRWWMQNFG